MFILSIVIIFADSVSPIDTDYIDNISVLCVYCCCNITNSPQVDQWRSFYSVLVYSIPNSVTPAWCFSSCRLSGLVQHATDFHLLLWLCQALRTMMSHRQCVIPVWLHYFLTLALIWWRFRPLKMVAHNNYYYFLIISPQSLFLVGKTQTCTFFEVLFFISCFNTHSLTSLCKAENVFERLFWSVDSVHFPNNSVFSS